MSRKNHSADSPSLASNANDTTGPGDVSNDGSVFAAGQTSSRLLADIRRMAPMIASGASLFASLLPRETYDQIYRDGPDVIFAGSTQPTGTAEAVEGGLRVNGRWPFASGCQHADWILAACVMTKDGQPLPGPIDGVPMTQFVFLPATYWQIEDTWHSAGLKGTGSHHVVLRDTLVPEANFADPSSCISCLPGPLYDAPLRIIPLLHAPVALGIAEGALNDLAEMAGTGH